MVSRFQKAQKVARKAHIGLVGPSGSGKTYSALLIASGLGSKIAVVDTENESASLYADKFDFDSMNLEMFSPAFYVDAIHAAEQAGYEVLVIDSLSHAWAGKGGALEMVDNAKARQKIENSYTAWRDVTPEHNALVDAMVRCKCHLIVTMRAKTEYVMEKDEQRGKTVVRKIGLSAIQRDGMEYEFDLTGDMNMDNALVVSKSRYESLSLTGTVIKKPGAELGYKIKAWLSDGVRATEDTVPSQVLPPVITVAPAPSEESDPFEEENLPTLGPAFDAPLPLAGQEVPSGSEAPSVGDPVPPPVVTPEVAATTIGGGASVTPIAEASDELYRIRTKYGWGLQQTKALARSMFRRVKFEDLDSAQRTELAMAIDGIVTTQASQKPYEVKSS